MGKSLDMERIAKALGAERRGKISPRGGYFGALQLAAEVTARFRVPDGGGRATDPSWSEQRLVRLSAKTLEQLEKLAEKTQASPMQVAALLLEQAVQTVVNQE
jgi:4-aminobutyrate aminotransferase-like enzyme